MHLVAANMLVVVSVGAAPTYKSRTFSFFFIAHMLTSFQCHHTSQRASIFWSPVICLVPLTSLLPLSSFSSFWLLVWWFFQCLFKLASLSPALYLSIQGLSRKFAIVSSADVAHIFLSSFPYQFWYKYLYKCSLACLQNETSFIFTIQIDQKNVTLYFTVSKLNCLVSAWTSEITLHYAT